MDPTNFRQLVLDADATDALTFNGSCSGVCQGIVMNLTVADDHAFYNSNILDVYVSWDGTKTTGFTGLLFAPTQSGVPGGDFLEPRRGFDQVRFRVREPFAGPYVMQFEGNGSYAAEVRITPQQGAVGSGDKLPNLVTLTPADVQVGFCSQYERTEQGAERCLRLSNGVGNVGNGNLEVRLDLPQGALAVAGLGTFVQRIYQADGSAREAPAAGAQLHVTHGHWHYAGLAGFQLFEYDLATGLRGDSVSQMKKSGFCFIDIGLIDDADVEPEPGPNYGLDGCFVPDPLSWLMGVTVGWYDYYDYGLDEQYVEISGVADGVYELVSTADNDNTLLESTDLDNAASVILRLTGDEVDVLKERGYYRVE